MTVRRYRFMNLAEDHEAAQSQISTFETSLSGRKWIRLVGQGSEARRLLWASQERTTSVNDESVVSLAEYRAQKAQVRKAA